MKVWTTEPGVQFYTGNFLARIGVSSKAPSSACRGLDAIDAVDVTQDGTLRRSDGAKGSPSVGIPTGKEPASASSASTSRIRSTAPFPNIILRPGETRIRRRRCTSFLCGVPELGLRRERRLLRVALLVCGDATVRLGANGVEWTPC